MLGDDGIDNSERYIAVHSVITIFVEQWLGRRREPDFYAHVAPLVVLLAVVVFGCLDRHLKAICADCFGRFSRIAIIAANMLPLFLAIFSFFRRSVTRMNSAVFIMVFIAFLDFLRITRSCNKKDRSPDWCLSEFVRL